MEIKDLFPVPIGFSLIDTVPIEEHNFLLNLEYHKHDLYDMVVTKEKKVLTTFDLPKIKKFIESELAEYAVRTLGTRQPLRFTQSWCTKHDQIPQYTFPHIHQNSIISGAYYVAADNAEGITFYKDDPYNDKYITWKTDPDLMEAHYWNWKWCKFSVRPGLLVLFPSQLKHAVEGAANANGLRSSLAFNTWFEGEIGIYDMFSQL